jgi:DNA primase large subunit
MNARHARYPFTEAAREAVGEAGVDLVAVIEREEAVVARGRDRVRQGLLEGTVDAEGAVDHRTELLSYPIARVLVSLLETPGAVEKYAAGEARSAHERFSADIERGEGVVTLDGLLREFDLASEVTRGEDADRVAVGSYLRLSPEGPDWRLVARELAEGAVRVSRRELYALLRRAVERRVADGLPLSVPASVAEPLEETVAELRRSLAGADYPDGIDRMGVDRSAFPPAVERLHARAFAGEELTPRERFTLVSFLAALGLDPGEIRDLCGRHDEAFTYTTERLAEGPSIYPPPSFASLGEYGLLEADEPREGHPLAAYAAALPGREEEGDPGHQEDEADDGPDQRERP